MIPVHTPAQRSCGLVIAGTRSGGGKTLTTLGLAAALQRRGRHVQGFKVGPDFIDPTHLAALSGRPVHNLDGWILRRDIVMEMFHRYAAGADVCLVEGVMGLFDGASGATEEGSTAQMAKWLGLPVVLVVDARSQGRSAAALVRGFAEFDPDLSLAGVIFTQVGGANHTDILREAMAASVPELQCLGFLSRNPDLAMPSRHLGLHMAGDLSWNGARGQALAAWVEQGVDMEMVQRMVQPSTTEVSVPLQPEHRPASHPGGTVRELDRSGAGRTTVRLGVARDQAFCFFYHENIRLLEQAGAEIVFFSPMTDYALPADVQGLFLGGGYPELYLEALSGNTALRDAVLRAAQSGMPIYAECGGMMYLLTELEDGQGDRFPMVGLFPGRAAMCSRFQALGYRKVELLSDGLLGAAGTTLRGHEFHYSRIENPSGIALAPALRIEDRRGRVSHGGFCRNNVLASYIHVHFGSHPQAATAFVTTCARWATTTNQRI